jgi:hypothetical protein
MRIIRLFVLASAVPVLAAVGCANREAVGAGGQAESVPPTSPTAASTGLHLNHFYVTLDDADYAAIKASDYLKTQFGVFEERTTTRSDLTYRGVYFYGDNTYTEFFNRADTIDNPHGNPLRAPRAVAFGVDNPGEALAEGQGISAVAITRGITDAMGAVTQVPWFSQFGLTVMPGNPPAPKSTVISTWEMEYVPDFLAKFHPELSTPSGVSRHDILARYVAEIAAETHQPQDDRLFGDITRIDIELPQSEIDLFVAQAKGFGAIVEMPDPTLTKVTAGEQVVDFHRADAGRTVSADLTLRKPAAAATMQFGNHTRLQLDGGMTAHWLF